jgi:periplasmic protein TonB
MKDLKLLLAFLLLSGYSFGQSIADTTFFDSKWNMTSKEKSSYYRLTTKELNGTFLCKDFTINGQIQMIGHFSSLDPEIREGEFIWYYQNGNPQQIVNHSNNQVIGKIKHYNKKGELDFSYCLNVDSLDNAVDFKRSIKKFYKYVYQEIKYPESAKNSSIEGQIMVVFYVSPQRQVERFAIRKGADDRFNSEVERVIKSFDNWEVPVYKNEKSYIQLDLPFSFTLK